MKNFIKTSILAAFMLFFFAVISHAATVFSTVEYGEKDTDGNVLVTVTFQSEYPQGNQEFYNNVTADGWTYDSENNKMTKTFNVAESEEIHLIPYIAYVSQDNEEVVIVATPCQYKKNIQILPGSNIVFVSSSNTSVATIADNKIQTKAAGKTMIQVRWNGQPVTFPLYVAEEDVPPVDPEDGKTSDGVDFSKATYTISDTQLIVGNVSESSKRLYYAFDTSSTGANTLDSTTTLKPMQFKSEKSGYVLYPANLNLLEQSQAPMYIHIYEEESNSSYKKVYDKKIDKPTITSLNKFTDTTMATHLSTIICYNLPYSFVQGRKLTYKIGKITDNDLLVALKNGDEDSVAQLLEYGKNDGNPVIEQTVDVNSHNGYLTDSKLFEDGSKLTDGAYYYLYSTIDDGDGTYIPLESISIGKASTYPTVQGYPWYIFFEGDERFNYDGITDPTTPDSKDKEEKKKPTVIPQTGESIIYISSVVVAAIVAVVLYKKFRKSF